MVKSIGRVRRTVENGREYLVAPLTSIVPGVLSGSKGPLYYPPDEIRASTHKWDGIPITVGHPVHQGENVSAKDFDVVSRQGIGEIRGTKYKNKLSHEAWIDVEKAQRVDPRVVEHL